MKSSLRRLYGKSRRMNTTRLPLIPLDVAQVTVLLVYGLYIMRNYQPEAPLPQTA